MRRIILSTLMSGGLAIFLLAIGCAPNPPIVAAAKSDKLEAVKALIATGVNVNDKGQSDYTPLHWAAYHGDAAIAELLLEHGAAINAKDDQGSTPLFLAVKYNRRTVIPVLLAHQADVNAKNNESWTPLMSAARNGYLDICKQLVEAGADIKWQEPTGKETAVSLALSKSRYAVVQYLAAANPPTTAPADPTAAATTQPVDAGHAQAPANPPPGQNPTITKSLGLPSTTQPGPTTQGRKPSLVPEQ